MEDQELKILARDRKNNPLLSRLDWSERAIERVLRVPAGFMRDRTQKRIEELAAERERRNVDFELVEEGIAFGLEQMKQMIGAYGGASPEMKSRDEAKAEAATEGPAAEECPVPAAERTAVEPASIESTAAESTAAESTAAESTAAESTAAESTAAEPDNRGFEGGKPALNEIGVMTELERRRGELGSSDAG